MNRRLRLLGLVALAAVLPSCGGGGGGGGGVPLPAVTQLKVVPGPGRAELSWVPVTGASDYRIQYSGPGVPKGRTIVARTPVAGSQRSGRRVAVLVRDLPAGTTTFVVSALSGDTPGTPSDAISAPILEVAASPSGGAANDRLGWSVAMLGDLDGDGRDDYIAGAFQSDNGPTADAGKAYVYSGATGAVLFTKQGTVLEERLGYSVGRVGDIDGDSVPDFIVGAPGQNGVDGAAWVYSGDDGSVIWVRDGETTVDVYSFGYSVSGAGDVNGDGREDFIVGAPTSFNAMNFPVGKAFVYSGLDGSRLHTFEGEGVDDRFGESVSGGADFNADGRCDLIVGAPGLNFGGGVNRGGAVYVYSGLDGSLLFKRIGESDWCLGVSVAAAGDVNGDGRPDFMAGANDGDRPFVGSGGIVRVYSGVDGNVLLELLCVSIEDSLGLSVAAAGDVDGDGYGDILSGMMFAPPGATLHTGGFRVYSGADGSLLYEVYSDQTSSALGFSVAGGGDVNGDGRSDFMAGAHAATVNSVVNSGAAYVFTGLEDLGILDGEGMTPFAPNGYVAVRIPQVAPSAGRTFAAAGGVGPYAWSLLTNRSGGSIDAVSGLYTTGSTADVYDTVRVTDADGRGRDTRVLVTSGGPAPVPLARPTSLRAILTAADTATLTWTDASVGESGFHVEYRTPTNAWLPLVDLGAGATSHAAAGLDVDKVYFFRLRAFDAVSDSPPSPVAMMILPAPTGLAAVAVGQTSANLTWVDNSGAAETGFQVETRALESGSWTLLAELPADTTAYAATGLPDTTMVTVYFRVRAVANVIESDWSNITQP